MYEQIENTVYPESRKRNKYRKIDNELRVAIGPKEVIKVTELPQNPDYMQQRYSYEYNMGNLFFINPTESEIDTDSQMMMKYDLQTKDSYTQWSNSNLRPDKHRCKKTKPEVVSQHHNKNNNLCRDEYISSSSLPPYYNELIPEVNRSRKLSPSSNLHRTESNSFHESNVIQEDYKYSGSQQFLSEHHIKYNMGDMSYEKRNQGDYKENNSYFINPSEARKIPIGQARSSITRHGDAQSDHRLRKKRQKMVDDMFCEVKSEHKPIQKPQMRTELNQAVKYQNSYTVLLNQTSTSNCCTHSFRTHSELKLRNKVHKPLDNMHNEMKPEFVPLNVSHRAELKQPMKNPNSFTILDKQTSTCNYDLLSYPEESFDQNAIPDQMSNLHYQGLNYKQYVIPKLSEKNSDIEEQMNSQINLIQEEKCTQTFRNVSIKKKTKTLMYKEQITQTIL